MVFDPDSISPDHLNDLRAAAESAWGDDSRHEQFVGHPDPSRGQCYVTSAWLQQRLGGHIGTKGGHYFWVSPDRSHVIDLTGDQFSSRLPVEAEGMPMDEEDEPWTYDAKHLGYRPGPVMYKRADHPIWKGFRVLNPEASDAESANARNRVKLFARRANAAMAGQRFADLLGADPYPGESPEKVDQMEQLVNHDEPSYTADDEPHEFRFALANGELHLSPEHEHGELLSHSGVGDDHVGPSAVGYAEVKGGHVLWRVESNIGMAGLRDVLAHYSHQVGWHFDGMTSTDGQPMGFGPVQSYWYREDGERVIISKTPLRIGRHIDVRHGIAYVPAKHPGLEDWAKDTGLKLAEVPGGGNMLDKMRHREDIEMFNNQDPKWEPEGDNPDFEPTGPFSCPYCDFKPKTFGEMKLHVDGHQPREEEIEDGHFPTIDDFDEPLPLRRNQPYPQVQSAIQVMVLPNRYELQRIASAELYGNFFGWSRHQNDPRMRYYGAYSHGELVGYGVVCNHRCDNAILMIQAAVSGRGVGSAILQRMQRHYRTLYSRDATDQGARLMARNGMVQVRKHQWRWAKGQEPKDLLEDDVPFVYDIQHDKLVLGYPGESTHDVRAPGGLTPGGIVEGTYQPGGKVTIQTASTWPFSVRHLLDLWQWTAPQMEVTGVEQMEADGSTSKLAAEQAPAVGPYLQTLVQADPAAHRAFQALQNAGGQVYVVGGAVRDALLNRVPNDLDLMVGGLSSADVGHALSQLPGQVNETGKRFGVFRYTTGGQEVEVALPRTDTYETGRRGEGKIQVDPNLPVEKDLERRDFTANSMAIDLNSGKLIDPYGGARDIERGVLRTTHPDSFREDPTRLVRALTAHGRFGLSPDEKTRQELADNAHLLHGESPDALNKTLDKLFKSENPAGAIRLAQQTGVLSHLFPEVADHWDFDQRNPHHQYPLGDHLMQVLDNVSRISTDPDVRMAALLHDVGKPASAWLDPATGSQHYYYNAQTGEGANHEEVGAQMAEDRLSALNYPRARINRVHDLIQYHMFAPFSTPKGARRFLQRVGDHADSLLDLREADQTGKGQTPEEVAARTSADQMRGLVEQARSQQAPTDVSALNVNGNDLIAMGLKPGPQIGQVLRYLTDEVVENPMLNDRAQLLQLAQSYVNAQPPEAFS